MNVMNRFQKRMSIEQEKVTDQMREKEKMYRLYARKQATAGPCRLRGSARLWHLGS
ncbi:hypothetical protein [Halalkalibacterium halodurans]|uniref:hypothetical protein n=1 Tax=Halalkalibacterium halodurans TaxID=86665 RepID=UPI001FBB08BF|nr:hypothetical protein [Halalkalibacterium halodurans]